MKLGVCWYPEQHPEERWACDTRRMADAGLTLVRMGEFAWGALEPALVQPVHAAIRRLGADVDIVGPLGDLTGYDIVVAPALYLIRQPA